MSGFRWKHRCQARNTHFSQTVPSSLVIWAEEAPFQGYWGDIISLHDYIPTVPTILLTYRKIYFVEGLLLVGRLIFQ